jgi:hypothetical protein
MPLENDENSPMRPQPPAIKDPPSSGGVTKPMRPQPPGAGSRVEVADAPHWEAGHEDMSGGDPVVDEDEDDYDRGDEPDWEQRAKDAFRFSTTYIDSNYRQQWDDSIRAFNNQHAGGSKYNSETFRKRSHLFVPITRTVIRKNEAAACQAFFSNQDLTSIQALNQGDKRQLISAALMKELLQYRLTHTIPWFQVLIGGIQDGQTQGAVVARVKWEYATRRDAKGKLIVAKDGPAVDLKPIENIRFDPSANWMDPINTSPYVIELIPMYIGDVKAKMTKPDPKGRQWHDYSDQELKASENPDDSTRMARLGDQQDPTQENRSVSDYDIIWVQRHIHRWDECDWEFYTLGNGKLLTDPELLEKTVFHGQRDYVLGVVMVETHKPLPTSVPQLVQPLQEGINNIENQRNDNVLLVLNKRHKVKRGTNVDTASLMRNVPGGVTMVDNMEDLESVEFEDITASSYQESDRKRQAFDDLVGNFNPMQMHQAGAPREAQGTVKMLEAPASLMTEYMLQTFSLTFVVRVLRQLVLLEQHYETDATILAIAGEKAKVALKFGIDKVTDDMLDHELTTTVNVGMGATSPVAKMARFVYAVDAFTKVATKPPQGVNLGEVWKEMMALSGYQDGERFSTQGNQEMATLEATNKKLMQMVQDLKRHKSDKDGANVVRLVTSREQNASREKIAALTHGSKTHLLYANHLLDQDDMLLGKALGATQLPGEQPPGAPGTGGGAGGAQGAPAAADGATA